MKIELIRNDANVSPIKRYFRLAEKTGPTPKIKEFKMLQDNIVEIISDCPKQKYLPCKLVVYLQEDNSGSWYRTSVVVEISTEASGVILKVPIDIGSAKTIKYKVCYENRQGFSSWMSKESILVIA